MSTGSELTQTMLDLMRSRRVEQEVFDLLDDPAPEVEIPRPG
jgi:hypothetical protein